MKNFTLKPKVIKFSSTQFMTDLEKAKVYVGFVKFLNNHFKRTLFTKRLYEHFYLHCGFIAHYDINGFYSEYFDTAERYHNTPYDSALAVDMYKELDFGGYEGLGGFYNTIMNNKSYGGYSDYKDLNSAIKESFSEYMKELNKHINKVLEDEEKRLIKRVEKISSNEIENSNSFFKNVEKSEIITKVKIQSKFIQKSLFDI